ncbi:hypothetical protein E2C01_015161 [Portunus trituberculatus]|uniref:Uncharacterized protein n=1 Tax=Portunus trituberculatus TaxID=210409 RepID=A0A5B7DM80_PORTR|nr:hypothetical protein [Portunus trituberculatus]
MARSPVSWSGGLVSHSAVIVILGNDRHHSSVLVLGSSPPSLPCEVRARIHLCLADDGVPHLSGLRLVLFYHQRGSLLRLKGSVIGAPLTTEEEEPPVIPHVAQFFTPLTVKQFLHHRCLHHFVQYLDTE